MPWPGAVSGFCRQLDLLGLAGLRQVDYAHLCPCSIKQPDLLQARSVWGQGTESELPFRRDEVDVAAD